MSNKIVNPNNARYPEYRVELEEIAKSGECPFCEGGYALTKAQKPPHWENEHWLIKFNDWAIPNVENHLVIITKRHVVAIEELTSKEWLSLFDAHDWMRKEYGLVGAIFVAREGDIDATGATVCHLHFQYYIPKDGKAIELRYGPPPLKLSFWGKILKLFEFLKTL